ncbi:hypothetical protein [Ensifer canadensis]
MAEVASPKRPMNHTDRLLDCEEAMGAAFQVIIERAAAAGWSQQEATFGLIGLIQTRINTMREN